MKRDVYNGHLEVFGTDYAATIKVASNYAVSLGDLRRYAETKAVLRKMMPVAQRFLGEGHALTLRMKGLYATSLYVDDIATQDDLREAVRTLEDAGRIARRLLGSSHPTTKAFEHHLRNSRAALRAREDSV